LTHPGSITRRPRPRGTFASGTLSATSERSQAVKLRVRRAPDLECPTDAKRLERTLHGSIFSPDSRTLPHPDTPISGYCFRPDKTRRSVSHEPLRQQPPDDGVGGVGPVDE